MDMARNAANLGPDAFFTQICINLIKVPVLSWPFSVCFTKPLNQQKKCLNKYSSFALQSCQVNLVGMLRRQNN